MEVEPHIDPTSMPAGKLRFGRERRLRASGEFRFVREKGKSRAGRYLVMNVARIPEKTPGNGGGEPAPSRYGFITSRKVGNAVARNRVRRRMREVVRLNSPDLLPGFWVVTVARYTAASADYQTLRQEWLRLAGQLGILSAHSPKI